MAPRVISSVPMMACSTPPYPPEGVWLPPTTPDMLYERKLRFSRLMPLATVVHSTEISGMHAMMKARQIRLFMKTSLRLRDAAKERLVLNRSKSMSGSCLSLRAAGVFFTAFASTLMVLFTVASLIMRSLSR